MRCYPSVPGIILVQGNRRLGLLPPFVAARLFKEPTSMRSLKLLLIAAFSSVSMLAQDDEQTELSRSLDSLLTRKIQTASKYMQKASQSPNSVTIITSTDIENLGLRTLEEVLGSVRDFYISYDRNYSYLGVRGFGRPADYNNRILLLVNGHTINDNFYGSAPFGMDFVLDLCSVDRIEVVRGPGSALYGSGAMFAVINVITKTGAAVDVSRADGYIGSNGWREASVLIGNAHKRGLNVLISSNWRDIEGQDIYFKEFDTEAANHGVAQGLDWTKQWSLMTTMSYEGFSLQGVLLNSRKGVPTAPFGTLFNDPDCWTLDRTGMLELKYEDDISVTSALMARGYIDEYHNEGAYPYESLQTFDRTESRKAGSEIQYRWDTSPKNRFIIGSEFDRVYRSAYNYGTASETYFNKDFPYINLSAYAQDEWQTTEQIGLVAGIRFDAWSHFTPTLSPRAALVLNPWKSGTVKLLIGHAFRAPSNYELHYEDTTSFHGVKASEGLNHEKITTVELILDQRLSGSMSASISAYDNEISGYIDQQPDPVDSFYQFKNISRARALGISGEIIARFRWGIAVDVSASYGEAKSLESEAMLTNSPSTLLKGNLSFPVTEFLRVGTTLRYESGRKTVYNTETDPFFLADLFVSARLDMLRTSVSGAPVFTIRIRNLTNKLYAFPAGYELVQPAIVQDGRTILAGLSLTF